MTVSLRTQPALDNIHVVAFLMSWQQLIIRRAASQQDARVVLTHGDEVLLRPGGAAGVVMGQFTYSVADRVINRTTHLRKEARPRFKIQCDNIHYIRSILLLNTDASSPLHPPSEVF